MNQGDFLICVAAGFFCAGYMSSRWWVEEGRKKGMKEGRMVRCSSFGRKIFDLRSGREGWESVEERGGRRAPVVGFVLERERHGMYTVVVVASEVRERSENVIRSDEGEDRKEEESEQAKEGGRYHNRR